MNVLTKLKGIKIPSGFAQGAVILAEMGVSITSNIIKEQQEKERITKVVEEILEAKGLNK